jgi:hypothetical protein
MKKFFFEKNNIRLLSLILALVMLCSLLAACGGEGSEDTTTAEATTAADIVTTSGIPEGYSFELTKDYTVIRSEKAGANANTSSFFDVKTFDVNSAFKLFLQELNAVFQLFDLAAQVVQRQLFAFLNAADARNRRITKVSRERREEEKGIATSGSARDAAFALAEKCRFRLFAVSLLVVRAPNVNEVGDVDETNLTPQNDVNPTPPIVVEDRVVRDRLQTAVESETVATERFKLVKKRPLRRRLLGTVLGFAFQYFKRDSKIEPTVLAFRLFKDERLKRREVVREPTRRQIHFAGKFHLRQDDRNRGRKVGRGKNFVFHPV